MYEVTVEKMYHDNGQLRSEIEYNIYGEIDGSYFEWYGNGKLCMEYYYKDGQYHGPCKSWFTNGLLESECTYFEDKRHGLCKDYHEDGTIKFHTTYIAGLKQGISRDHKINGELQTVRLWNKDKRIPLSNDKLVIWDLKPLRN